MLSTQYIRPAQMTEVDAVGDQMAFVSPFPFRQRRIRSVRTNALNLKPLAVVTTPGHLTTRTTLYAIRSRSRRRRALPVYFLEAPLYLSPLVVPGTPGQAIVDARYLTVAERTRREMPLRAGHSRLRAPKLVRVRVWPL